MKKFVIGLLAVAATLALPLAGRAATLTVFAAASLTEALKEIAAGYETQAGDKIVFNFSGSGLLARQIEAGAPADLFFSADEAKMDALEKQGLIVRQTRRSRLSNRLVVVTTVEHPFPLGSPKDLVTPKVKRLVLGDPKTVPAGTYAKEYLSQLGLWSGVEKKVVPCESVRAVLAAVESGNVEAGLVYRTDAAMSRKVKVAYEVPVTDGPKISYPVAVVKGAKHPAAAAKFLEHLTGPEAGAIFLRRGFLLLPSEEKK